MRSFAITFLTLFACTALHADDPSATPSATEETPEQTFKRLDQNQDNQLTKDELHDHYIDQLLAGYDQDNDGTITRSEVVGAVQEQEKEGQLSPAMAQKVELEFDKLDVDKNNRVNRQELETHLGPLGTAVLFPGTEPQQTNIDQPILLQQWQDLHTTGGIPVMSIRF